MGGKYKKAVSTRGRAGADMRGEPPTGAAAHRFCARRKHVCQRPASPGAGPPGRAHLLRCSISACFSRSSRRAEARLSSSCPAPATAWYADARPGRMPLKEGVFLLQLHKVLMEYLTKPCDEHTPRRHSLENNHHHGAGPPGQTRAGPAPTARRLPSTPTPSHQVTPGLRALKRLLLSDLDDKWTEGGGGFQRYGQLVTLQHVSV